MPERSNPQNPEQVLPIPQAQPIQAESQADLLAVYVEKTKELFDYWVQESGGLAHLPDLEEKLRVDLESRPSSAMNRLAYLFQLQSYVDTVPIPDDLEEMYQSVKGIAWFALFFKSTLDEAYKNADLMGEEQGVLEYEKCVHFVESLLESEGIIKFQARAWKNSEIALTLWNGNAWTDSVTGQEVWLKSRVLSHFPKSSNSLRQDIIKRMGRAEVFFAHLGRSSQDKTNLLKQYRGTILPNHKEDSSAWKRKGRFLSLYSQYVSPIEGSLSSIFEVGYQESVVERLKTIEEQSSVPVMREGTLSDSAPIIEDFVKHYQNESRSDEQLRTLAREYYELGAESAGDDGVFTKDHQIAGQSSKEFWRTYSRLGKGVIQNLNSFSRAIENLAVQAIYRPAKGEMSIESRRKIVARFINEFEVVPEVARYALLALDDLMSSWPILERETVVVGHSRESLYDWVEQKFVQRLSWDKPKTFEQDIVNNPAIFDARSGFPEAVIHAHHSNRVEFTSKYSRLLVESDPEAQQRYFELLERVLLVPEQRLRIEASKFVKTVLCNRELIRCGLVDLDVLRSYEVVRQLLPWGDRQFIGDYLWNTITTILREQPASVSNERLWQLRTMFAADRWVGTEQQLDELFPERERGEDTITVALGEQQESYAAQTSMEENENTSHQLKESISIDEWELLFPIYGNKHILKQYQEFFRLESLEDDSTLPELWLRLCYENAKDAGEYIELLGENIPRDGSAELALAPDSYLAEKGLRFFQWKIENGHVTVAFLLENDKEFTLTTQSLQSSFEQFRPRSNFFEPYLRAAVLQAIYNQLKPDDMIDILSELNSFHQRKLLEEATTENLEELQELTDDEASPQESTLDEVSKQALARLLSGTQAEAVVAAIPEIWKDRVLTTPEEIVRFFNLQIPYIDVTEDFVKKLQAARIAMLMNLRSQLRAKALPSCGVTIMLTGGKWEGRSDWDTVTKAHQIELHPIEEGSSNLARVVIHYPDNLTLTTVIEFDGMLCLGDGIDDLQRILIESVTLRCLEQEVVQFEPPKTVDSGQTASQPVSYLPDATALPTVHQLREAGPKERERQIFHGPPRQSRKDGYEAYGYYVIPARRVSAGIYRSPETGEYQAKDRGKDRVEKAAKHGIELVTVVKGKRKNPDRPEESIETNHTFRKEYEFPVPRKKIKKLSE